MECGGQMALYGLSPGVQMNMVLLGLDKILAIFGTRAEACDHLTENVT
jgi:anti-anti-sigma regulatory factor